MNVVRAGVGVIILRDNKILLGRRSNIEAHGKGTWCCPGGKIEFEENLAGCAKREVQEETGIKINEIKLISITNDIAYSKHYITLGFLCESFEGEPEVVEPESMIEWRWFPLTDLPKPLFLPSEKLINNYLSKTIYKGD